MLIATGAISNLIREGKTFQIPSMMQVGKALGMVTLNDALIDLVTKKLVAPEEAYAKCVDKAGFEGLLKRAGVDHARAAGESVMTIVTKDDHVERTWKAPDRDACILVTCDTPPCYAVTLIRDEKVIRERRLYVRASAEMLGGGLVSTHTN